MIVVQPLKCSHDLWDRGVVDLYPSTREVIAWNLQSKIDILIRGPLKIMFLLLRHRKEDVCFLSTINLWLPLFFFLGFHRKVVVGLHNNFERRFSLLLFLPLNYITSNYFAYKCLGKKCRFIVHPCPEVDKGGLSRSILFCLTSSMAQLATVKHIAIEKSLTLVIKGVGGVDYVEDWEGLMCSIKYLFIGRDYSRRCSSIVAQFISIIDGLLVEDLGSAMNLYASHGFGIIRTVNVDGREIYLLENEKISHIPT